MTLQIVPPDSKLPRRGPGGPLRSSVTQPRGRTSPGGAETNAAAAGAPLRSAAHPTPRPRKPRAPHTRRPAPPAPLTSSRARTPGGVVRRRPPPAARSRRSAPSEKGTRGWALCARSSREHAKATQSAYLHLPVVVSQVAPRHRHVAARDRSELLAHEVLLLPHGFTVAATHLRPELRTPLRHRSAHAAAACVLPPPRCLGAPASTARRGNELRPPRAVGAAVER